MKPGTPAWSVVCVVFNGPFSVLAVSRAFNLRDPALPGGDSELDDATPAQTAARELYEETGLQAVELRCMDRWVGDRGQPVFAFFIAKWRSRLRSSDEGKPFWTKPETLFVKSALYREEALRLMKKLGRIKAA